MYYVYLLVAAQSAESADRTIRFLVGIAGLGWFDAYCKRSRGVLIREFLLIPIESGLHSIRSAYDGDTHRAIANERPDRESVTNRMLRTHL